MSKHDVNQTEAHEVEWDGEIRSKAHEELRAKQRPKTGGEFKTATEMKEENGWGTDKVEEAKTGEKCEWTHIGNIQYSTECGRIRSGKPQNGEKCNVSYCQKPIRLKDSEPEEKATEADDRLKEAERLFKIILCRRQSHIDRIPLSMVEEINAFLKEPPTQPTDTDVLREAIRKRLDTYYDFHDRHSDVHDDLDVAGKVISDIEDILNSTKTQDPDVLREALAQAHMAGQHYADSELDCASYADAYSYAINSTKPEEKS